MKRVVVIFIVSLLALSAAAVYGRGNGDEPACVPVRSLRTDDLAFQHGEKLSYTMHYRWAFINADVASASITLDTTTIDGRKVFDCRILGRTAKFFDSFFKVREEFRSWFTVDGIRPVRFFRDAREGGYYAVNNYKYVWDGTNPHISADLDNKKKGPRHVEMPLTECTYDLPALFFMARNMDFDKVVPNVKYPMTFAIDDDILNVYFIWRGREQKYVKGLGTVNTIKFSARLVQGQVFKSDTDMDMWISDDENRIPICFEAPIHVGTVAGRLEAWEGLKYEFKAFVKADEKK